MPFPDFETVRRSLALLREQVPQLVAALEIDAPISLGSWTTALDTRILPRFSPDFPLMVSVTGGGSSGKSTLFNSLLQHDLSTVGGRAGLNRRVLVAVHPSHLSRAEFLPELFRPFGGEIEPLADKQILTTPGAPVYVAAEKLPRSLILMDTPDFDVGMKGEYLNRGLAAPVLTASDVFVYIFTNATYNAKANTDFIREHLTRIGQRHAVLVYRVYESFSDDEVMAHARTVSENLYEDPDSEYVLAVYRADDTNLVAAGQAPSVPRRVGSGEADLLALLGALDPRVFREAQNQSMVEDVIEEAVAIVSSARRGRDLLVLYRNTLRLALGRAVADALTSLPLERIALRVREIFEATDSKFVKFSRKAGRVTGAPLRGLIRMVGGKKKGGEEDEKAPLTPTQLMQAKLVESANVLRRWTLAEEVVATTTGTDPDGAQLIGEVRAMREREGLTGAARPYAEMAAATEGTFNVCVQAPQALTEVRKTLSATPWSEHLAFIEESTESIMKLPQELDQELLEIVSHFRKDMPFMKRARASLVASLNVIPPVLALTYVFATYDPVGATTIAGKLSGLFGMQDLWATVSIPASTGLDEATRRDLEKLLQPIVDRWFASRAQPVRTLFLDHISGPVINEADARIEEASELLQLIDGSLRPFADESDDTSV